MNSVKDAQIISANGYRALIQVNGEPFARIISKNKVLTREENGDIMKADLYNVDFITTKLVSRYLMRRKVINSVEVHLSKKE